MLVNNYKGNTREMETHVTQRTYELSGMPVVTKNAYAVLGKMKNAAEEE